MVVRGSHVAALAAGLAMLLSAGKPAGSPAGAAAQSTAAQTAGWWMEEPFRLLQTNLRETDTALDPQKLVQQVADFPANVLLFGMGGIVAHHPTQVDFHYPSRYLPPGRDTFGEVLKAAHARGIRVIGRFDLSKTQKPVYDAHPEWFFVRGNGEPVMYNGLYSTCINGGYYRGQAMKILAEALDRYDVDGLFFNMFGNPSSDYSGNPTGHCHCDSCKRRFQERFGRPLPSVPDADYRRFLEDSAFEVARSIADLIHSRRPRAGFFTYLQEHVDGIMSESNTSLDRTMPWPYASSDNVNRGRNSQPGKMAVDLSIGFVAISNRFVTVPPAEIQLRAWQNMAHGGGPTFVALGTLDQEDMTGINAARPVFRWHAEHADLYAGQESAARVLLLPAQGRRGNDYRGFFRILSEQHIPFAVSANMARLRDRPWDLVIAPKGAPPELDAYVRQGGRLLLAGSGDPGLALGNIVRRWTDTQSAYFRIRDHAIFPSLKDTQLVFLAGEYLELEPTGKPLLTLVPPSMFGPPEKVHLDQADTDKPGLVLCDYGRGKVAYLPWNVGDLYYQHSSEGHARLVADLIDHLLPEGRQLRTSAHPLVEITLMRQPKRNRTIVHLVNVSGHFSTGFFPPVGMRDIRIEVAGAFRRARSARLDMSLPVRSAGGYTGFSLPQLGAYDAVVLE
ncbi:MAG: hypothetical protein IT159_13650 [Bryobacterales bacterium]|nr:hypothetical protein [Bryobacterales bacterium]